MDGKTIGIILGVGITAAAASAIITSKLEKSPDSQHATVSQSATGEAPEMSREMNEVKGEHEREAESKVTLSTPPKSAQKSVAPEVKYKTVTERVCEQKPVSEEVQVQDVPPPPQHSPAGIIVGGLIGGVVGNQVGNGDGRTLATIAGAGAGAYVGDKVAQKNQKQQPTSHTETKTVMKEVCHDETKSVPIK